MALTFTQKMLTVYWRELSTLAKEARLAKKLSIRNLARLTKTSASSLSRFEAQKRTMTTQGLEKIAGYLGITINDLGRLELITALEDKKKITCPKCLFRIKN